MTKELQPMIQDTLPAVLRSFHFQHFKLGAGVPQILGVEVSDAYFGAQLGVELRVSFKLEPLGNWI